MSTIALPSWVKVQSLTPPTIMRSTLASTGRYSGHTDISDFMSGDVWAMSIGLVPMAREDSPRLEALVNQLVGGLNLLSCHHLGSPVVRGSLRGSPVLSATMAQGAQAMSVSGALSAPNLLRGSDFEFDTNADGLCDNWLAYSTGNTGVVTRERTNTTAFGSGYSQTVACASMGPSESDRAGVVQIVSFPGGAVGTPLTASAYAWGDVGQKVRVWAQLWSGGVSGQVVIDSGGITLTNAWARYAASGVASQAFDEVRVYVWQQERPGSGFGPAVLHVDKAQIEVGAAGTDYAGPPSFKAGDMLGLGNAIFQAAEDGALNDAGAGSIPVVNKARSAIASATPVIWNRPAALWRLSGTPQMLIQPGYANGVQLDLVEKAFA